MNGSRIGPLRHRLPRLPAVTVALAMAVGVGPGGLARPADLDAQRAAPPAAQAAARAAADSALVGRVLLAEDRRDGTDAALEEGLRHADPRIRRIAWRARARIADPDFAVRDSMPAAPPPPHWPEPDWLARYRALATAAEEAEAAEGPGCGPLRAALSDAVWPVRLRAASLLPPACGRDDDVVANLRRWVETLPAAASRRAPDGVSWHAAAHGLVALARLRPDEARERLPRLAEHGQWQVRMYAARAAAELAAGAETDAADAADPATGPARATALRWLRTLARNPHDNVKAAAIDALSGLTGHADDDLYLEALRADGAQAVRAAARALEGSPRDDVAAAASAAFERWVDRGSESERDARLALLAAAGRPASDDRPPAVRVELPGDAVALALGAERRLRVTMAASSGGGAFVVRLRGDVAPLASARILDLARAGYYDATAWHRVVHDFVVQGGGPGANEYVGHPRYLRDELGTLPHARGTVGLSTRGRDTGDAQWFINLRDNLRLGGDYTVFAEVVEGMDVVDRIMEGDVIARVEPI